LRGIDHHDTLPEKKTPLKIDGWKRILFLFWGEAYLSGANSLFSWSGGLRIHSTSMESTT